MKRPVFTRIPPLSGRDRRAVSLGAVVVLPGLLFGLIVRPCWQMWSDLRSQAAQERSLLARELRLLQDAHYLNDRFDVAGDALLGIAPRLFSGRDSLASAATLADYVGSQAVQHRVFVQQSEARTGGSMGSGVSALEVELRAVSDLEGIVAFLDALERGEKLVRVERLVLTRAQSVGTVAQADAEVLGMTATMVGYMLEAPTSAVPVQAATGPATESGN